MTVTAPTFIITSGNTDRQPKFQVTGDIQVLDRMRMAYGTSVTFAGATEITNDIDSAEFAGSTFSMPTGVLADGTWFFRIRTERASGTDISPWSNTQSITLGGTIIAYNLNMQPGALALSGRVMAPTYSGALPTTMIVHLRYRKKG